VFKVQGIQISKGLLSVFQIKFPAWVGIAKLHKAALYFHVQRSTTCNSGIHLHGNNKQGPLSTPAM
jgi:hypothetical protein